jgi:enamine deaminase RidA (YjgF/YER057c/UK114 family)
MLPKSPSNPANQGHPDADDLVTPLNSRTDRRATLRRLRAPGIELAVVEASPMVELHATATPVGNEPPGFTVRRLAEMLNAWDATVVRTIGFGSVRVAAMTHAALRQSLDDPNVPLTWVEGVSCDGKPLAGMQVHAVAGTVVKTLPVPGHTSIRSWKDSLATHCAFNGLGMRATEAGRADQARAALGELESGLSTAGMSFQHVARTWFYLDDILDWYGDFNRVRTDFFKRSKLGMGCVPASTGVSGRNPSGSAVALAAWAIKPLDPATPAVQIVPSPKQCPAPAYGSAFSRAVEIQSPGFRQLLISGTASIEPGGQTVHAGDVGAQIETTMEVIQAILESRGMTLNHATRATAYFRSLLDAPRFAGWLERHELRSLPVVSTGCDICRDDLLFELELDAIATP